MAHEVYVIEVPSAPSSASLRTVLHRAQIDIAQTLPWSEFVPEKLNPSRAALMIANACPGCSAAQNFFQWLRARSSGNPVFAMLPSDNPELIETAIPAVDDFLLWPVRDDELFFRLLRLLGPANSARQTLQPDLAGELGCRRLLGEEPAFVDAVLRLAQSGRSEAAVMLTGETGTGKELFAHALHLLSRRRSGPFIPVECGSIPEHLFESEVFGHLRGAFTDARSEHKGLVSIAHGGTLFLDEIDSLPLALQGKLLRLLQEQTYRPLGSEQYCRADVRVIAATNRDLPALVQQQRFRADLYFRLDVLRVHLPPLRERRGDVALLARHFTAEICNRDGLGRKFLTPAALRKLECWNWPGNVRELQNVVHRATLAAPGAEILPLHLTLGDEPPVPPAEESCNVSETFRAGKRRAIESFERSYVSDLLQVFRGNMTRAARQAGKDRRAFGRLAKKYGLTQPQA